MNYKQHILGGIGLGLLVDRYIEKELVINYFNIDFVFYYLGIALGSLIPDIDTPKSWIGKRLLFLSWPIYKLFNHRGLTHSLAFTLFLTFVISNLFHNEQFTKGIFIGCLSHLILDMFDLKGIPLLYPIKRRYRFYK